MPVMGTDAAKPGNPASVVTDWSVDPDDWGEFLCRTFDLWLAKGLGKVTVHWFESLAGQWAGKPALICSLAEVCGRSLVTMEMDGSVYSCDHFVYPEYRLGNLLTPSLITGNSSRLSSRVGGLVSRALVPALVQDSRRDKNAHLGDMVYSAKQRRFGLNKRDTLPEYCKRCPYRFACNGECPKNRFLKTPDGQPGLNYLCSGNKRFFAHADPHLRRIAGGVTVHSGENGDRSMFSGNGRSCESG